MTSPPLQAAALISGAGRTVCSLEREILRRGLPVRIAVVLAHDEHLPGVKRCRALGLNVQIVSGPRGSETSDRIDRILRAQHVELICLCGYLRKFRVAECWKDRVINIHPALLPEFGGKGMYGKRVHEAVLESGRSRSGCTVHWVDEEYDHGEHILQKSCPVLPGDDPISLGDRVFGLECEAYPEALQIIVGSREEDPACKVGRS